MKLYICERQVRLCDPGLGWRVGVFGRFGLIGVGGVAPLQSIVGLNFCAGRLRAYQQAAAIFNITHILVQSVKQPVARPVNCCSSTAHLHFFHIKNEVGSLRRWQKNVEMNCEAED